MGRGSDLLGLIGSFLGGVVGILDMGVRAGAVGVLDEYMQVVLPIHQDLILNHTSLLQIL